MAVELVTQQDSVPLRQGGPWKQKRVLNEKWVLVELNLEASHGSSMRRCRSHFLKYTQGAEAVIIYHHHHHHHLARKMRGVWNCNVQINSSNFDTPSSSMSSSSLSLKMNTNNLSQTLVKAAILEWRKALLWYYILLFRQSACMSFFCLIFFHASWAFIECYVSQSVTCNVPCGTLPP